MHTFGILQRRIREICKIADDFDLIVLEDAAEALGSLSKGKAVGGFGKCGIYSFNANKIITTGGGGMIITDDMTFIIIFYILLKLVKYLTNTNSITMK